MESPTVKMTYSQYKIFTVVRLVEPRYISKWVSGYGAEAEFMKLFLGYYIGFEGSTKSINLGFDKPDYRPGDQVEIIIRKTNDKP